MIAIIAVNLRPAITGVGPLIHEIRLDTGLSNTLLGLLTTLPVVALGVFSVLTPAFTRRLGMEGTMALALMLLTAGILVRIVPNHAALYLGTLVLGVGIALGNVLLPGITKEYFPHRFGLVTGIYAGMLGIGAAVASGLSVPLSEGLGLGWRWALGIWAGASLLALILWAPRLKNNQPTITATRLHQSLKQLGTSRVAWDVSLFMGTQALTFYTLAAWLPEVLIERGMSPALAGWMLALSQATGIIGTFVIPALADRVQSHRRLVIAVIAGELISLAGLIVPTLFMVEIWISILGFCLGASFGLALLFIGLRAQDTETANHLSGMSQSVGYSLAATGPIFFGAFYDTFQSWTLPLLYLIVVALVKTWSGVRASRKEYV